MSSSTPALSALPPSAMGGSADSDGPLPAVKAPASVGAVHFLLDEADDDLFDDELDDFLAPSSLAATESRGEQGEQGGPGANGRVSPSQLLSTRSRSRSRSSASSESSVSGSAQPPPATSSGLPTDPAATPSGSPLSAEANVSVSPESFLISPSSSSSSSSSSTQPPQPAASSAASLAPAPSVQLRPPAWLAAAAFFLVTFLALNLFTSSILFHPLTLVMAGVLAGFACHRAFPLVPSLFSLPALGKPTAAHPAHSASAAPAGTVPLCTVCLSDKCNHAAMLLPSTSQAELSSTLTQSAAKGVDALPKAVLVTPNVDQAFRIFLDRLIKDYVNFWYDTISADDLFIDEVRTAFRMLVLSVVDRARKVDWVAVVLNEIMPLVADHFLCYSRALQALQAERKRDAAYQSADEELEKLVLQQFEDAGHFCMKGRSKELTYWRRLTSRALHLLLPEALTSSPATFHLIREILAVKLLEPSLKSLYDPDLVNRLLYKALSEYVPTDGPWMDGAITRLRTQRPLSAQPSSQQQQQQQQQQDEEDSRVVLLAGYGGVTPLSSVLNVSLPDILNTPPLLFSFMKFMEREHALSILQFCLTAESYNEQSVLARAAGEKDAVAKQAKDLLATYIRADGPEAVPIPEQLRAQIEEKVEAALASSTFPDANCFLPVYDICYKLLVEVYSPLYQRSEFYYHHLCSGGKAVPKPPLGKAHLPAPVPPLSAAAALQDKSRSSKIASFRAKTNLSLSSSASTAPAIGETATPSLALPASAPPSAPASGIPPAKPSAAATAAVPVLRPDISSILTTLPSVPSIAAGTSGAAIEAPSRIIEDAGSHDSDTAARVATSQRPRHTRNLSQGSSAVFATSAEQLSASASASLSQSLESLSLSPMAETNPTSLTTSLAVSPVASSNVSPARSPSPAVDTSSEPPLLAIPAPSSSTPESAPSSTASSTPSLSSTTPPAKIDIKRWRATISHVEVHRDHLKKHIMYRINIAAPLSSLPAQYQIAPSSAYQRKPTEEVWVVTRRYTEFDLLDTCLRILYDNQVQVELPGKKTFGNLDASFVDNRRVMLEKYLQTLIADVNLHECTILYDFLIPSTRFRQVAKAIIQSSDISRGIKAVPHKLKEISVGIVTAPLQWFGDHSRGKTSAESDPSDAFLARNDVSVISEWQRARFQRQISNNAAQSASSDASALGKSVWSNESALTPLSVKSVMDAVIFILMQGHGATFRQLTQPDTAAPGVPPTPGYLEPILALAKYLAENTLQEFAAQKLRTNIEFMLTENEMLDMLQLLYSTTFDEAVVRTGAEREEARRQFYDEIFRFVPKIAQHVVGLDLFKNCADNIFDLLQRPTLNKQIVHAALDVVFLKLFPELSESEAAD